MGVPADEVTANDFVQVRAKLVRRLGGANEALVWTRVHYRCHDGAHRHVDGDGMAWWPASNEQIGEEVGLSADQVRRALAALMKGGFVVSEEHRLQGNYDRTRSWRTVVESRQVEAANSPDGGGDIAERTGRNRRQDPANSPDVPSLKTLEEESAPKRATQLPKVFVITDEMRAWAAEAAPLVDVDAKLGEWMDYWRGRGTPMKDWVATWRNGMRKQQDFAVRDGRTRQQPAPVQDVTAEVLREQRDAWLAEHGITLEELEANKHDPAWRARIEGRAA
jgi:hypothetical protein